MGDPEVQKAIWATAAAVVPALITLFGSLARSDRRPRGHKRLLDLADLWAKLPEGSAARREMGALIDTQAEGLAKREADLKPINPFNVGLTTFFSLLLGLACYGLFNWALTTATPWAWLAWVVAMVVLLFTVVFIAAAIGTWRNPTVAKKPKREQSV